MNSIRPTKWLSTEEVAQLVASSRSWASDDLQNGRRQGAVAWALVDAALGTGLRRGELRLLNVGDLLAEQGVLRVWRLKKRKGKQRDELLVSPSLVKHLVSFIAWKRAAGESIEASAPLLVGKRGRFGGEGLSCLWRSAIVRAGLPVFYSIHCARHTYGSHMAHKSGSIEVVRQQLGHSSVETTAKFYAHAWTKDIEKAVSSLYEPDGV